MSTQRPTKYWPIRRLWYLRRKHWIIRGYAAINIFLHRSGREQQTEIPNKKQRKKKTQIANDLKQSRKQWEEEKEKVKCIWHIQI